MQSFDVVGASTRTLCALLVGALLALGIAVGPRLAAAQDATPPGGGAGVVCEVAADGTPAADGATPAASPAAASPAAALEPTPAGSDATDGMTATVRALAECVNAGDFEGAAALLTDNYIETVLGVGVDEAASALEGAERMRIRVLQTPETYDDGSASVIVVYEGFLNTTGAPIAERWFFVNEGGVYKIDRVEPAELPAGIS